MQVRLLLMALLLLPVTLVRGQFNIAILPTGGLYLRSQLWNISISNTSTATVEATIHLEMKDIQTRQTVLSAQTAPFRVTPGVKKIQLSGIEPVIYNAGPGMSGDRSSNATLPIGKYQVCYQLIWKYGENQTAAADDCDEIEVEPLSPPLLTMPENDSVVTTLRPQFTWVPPAPLSMFGDLNYDLLISPVYEGQSITDAIRQNLPLQQGEGLRQPAFNYPLQGPQLEKGKRYVWQVIARDRMQYAVKSEVWAFRTGDTTAAGPGDNTVYLVMDGRSGGSEAIAPDILHIKYTSATSAHTAVLVLKAEDGTTMARKNISLQQGDNYLHISLSGKFQSKLRYTAVLQEPDGKAASLSFTIK
jgi:hypothetical protein